MKVYISGKISDLPINEVKLKFDMAAMILKEKGYTPINPLNVCPFDKNKTWNDYMVADIAALLDCDCIYMLKDWGQSKGARIEYNIAKELEIKVLFEGTFNF